MDLSDYLEVFYNQRPQHSMLGQVTPGSFAGMVCRLSEVEGFHVHQMRHAFACQWLERGGSLAALQHVLGTSIVTTQRYAQLTYEAVMREA